MSTRITPIQLLSFVISNIKNYPSSLFIMFSMAITWSIGLSVEPYLLKIIFNRLNTGTQQNVFAALLGPILLYLGMYLLTNTMSRLYSYFVEIKMIPHLHAKITDNAFSQLINKKHEYYQNNLSGSLANKINDLSICVPELVQIVIEKFFAPLLAITIAIITLWQVNIFFAIIMLIWTLAFIAGSLIFSKHLTKQADDLSECRSGIVGNLVDVLSNILSVRMFTAKKYEQEILRQNLQESIFAEKKLYWSFFWMCFYIACSFFLRLHQFMVCWSRSLPEMS